MNRKLFISTLATLSAVACGDPLKDAQRIEELRVLGARIAIDDAPDRASPEAGESASVEWLLADPSGLPATAVWHMSVCVAEPTTFDVPYCRDAPLGSAEQSEPSDATPSIAFTVPDADTLGDAKKLAVLAIFCDAGTVEVGDDFESTTCSGAATIQKASFEIFLDDGENSNENPRLDGATLAFDGDPWPADGSSVDCSDEATPRLPADGKEHPVKLTLAAEAREKKAPELGTVRSESLQISHFSTLGEFDRRFSDVNPDDKNLTIEVHWKAPGKLNSPTPASFYFVVRDDRGGVSWLTRSVCIDP